jgi:hypothetical protein
LLSKVRRAFAGKHAVAPIAISTKHTILVALSDPEFARLLHQQLEADNYTPVGQMPKGFEPGAVVVDSIEAAGRYHRSPMVLINGKSLPLNLATTRLVTSLQAPTVDDVMEAIRAICPSKA